MKKVFEWIGRALNLMVAVPFFVCTAIVALCIQFFPVTLLVLGAAFYFDRDIGFTLLLSLAACGFIAALAVFDRAVDSVSGYLVDKINGHNF